MKFIWLGQAGLLIETKDKKILIDPYTDEGIDGVGEATLEYKEKALLGAVEHIKEYLVGQNPLDIEKHWHTIYRDAYWRGGAVLMSALSAVETALWDILGKSLNVQVYRLLGGKTNEKVRIYVNGWFAGAKTPKEFGEKGKGSRKTRSNRNEMGSVRKELSGNFEQRA